MTRSAKSKVCTVTVVMLLALSAAVSRAVAEGTPSPSGASAPAPNAPGPSALPAQPPAPPPLVVLPPQPPPSERPGFLHQLGVWWNDSVSFFDKTIRGTRGTVDDLNKKSGEAAKGAVDAAKNAATATGDAMKGAATATGDAMKGAVEITKDTAGTIARLPNMRPVQVRERCAKAPNGASDCDSAAVAACRAKGFSTGKPLDVRTAANCDATVARTRQIPDPSECPIETVVIRALCQ